MRTRSEYFVSIRLHFFDVVRSSLEKSFTVRSPGEPLINPLATLCPVLVPLQVRQILDITAHHFSDKCTF